MRSINLILLLTAISLLALFVSCTTTENKEGKRRSAKMSAHAPGWFNNRIAPASYDRPETYLLGFGASPPDMAEADAVPSARISAQTEISEQIMTYIESTIEKYERELQQHGDSEFLSDMIVSTKQETSDILAGAVTVNHEYNPKTGTAFCACAMDRRKLAERLYAQTVDKVNAANGYLESAKSSGPAGDRLKSLVRAERALDVAVSNQVKVLGVANIRGMEERFQKFNLGDIRSRLTSMYDRLVSSIRTEAVSGDKQTASLSGYLGKPVTVRFSAAGRALAGFPVAVLGDEENKEKFTAVPASGATNSRGEFSFELRELEGTGRSTNTLFVLLDYQSLEKRSILDPPSCTVTYLMPSIETTRVAVVIHETIDRKKIQTPHSKSLFEDALGDLGFKIVTANLNGQDPRNVVKNPKKLARLLEDQCDYVIAGIADAKFSSVVHNMVFYKTRLPLNADEIETAGNFHLELTREQTKEGTNKGKEMQAAEFSLNKAVNLAMEKLGEKFISRFETGAAWAE